MISPFQRPASALRTARIGKTYLECTALTLPKTLPKTIKTIA